MQFSEFRKDIKSPQPAYLLVTDQEYLKKKVFEYCQEQVDEQERTFNWSVFDLEKDRLSKLLNAARTVPLISDVRWIYVKNADQAGGDLSDYLKNPSSNTIMILEARKRPRSWPRLPTIEMSERTDPVRWVTAKVKAENFRIEAGAAETLVELVGDEYHRLESELEKLFLWEYETRKISRDSVLQMTRQAREYDVFTLIEAIARRNAKQALQVLDRLYGSGMNAPQILSMLYWSFRRVLVAREMLEHGQSFQAILRELKIWSYKNKQDEIRKYPRQMLVDILVRLRHTDCLCKTTSTNPRAQLERVIVDTCRS